VRESPALEVVTHLIGRGAQVSVYDPVAMPAFKRLIGGTVRYASSALDCITGSDCCIIATAWDEFKLLKPDDFASHMRIPVIIDGRRIYDAALYHKYAKFSAVGLPDAVY
jgi:UDPglucose 6-dehydrogenase